MRVIDADVAHRLPTDNSQSEPDLAEIYDAWPTLPEAVRAGIIAMVRIAAGAKINGHEQ